MRLRSSLAPTLLLGALLLAGCASTSVDIPADTTLSDTTVELNAARQDPAAAYLMSAFFGLDNGLPLGTNVRICRGAGGADGMPVIFSQEIDQATMQAGDFRVLRKSGALGEVVCVTLAPALDTGELRTALLIGEFGSADDPAVAVEIGGNLLSIDRAFNFKGATIAVTPLAPGPTLILAELVPEAQWELGKAGGPWGTGSGCPTGTLQVVRATWAGGVTKPGGEEADDAERALYSVTLAVADGSASELTPFALGDLGDGDNNHELCLDRAGTPLRVAFPAGHLTDPNEDLNPDTTILITSERARR
ncbi:MAG: hypothetical protein H7Z42_13610 [Roseiflexaceae bacterium]|nr:hypothetical protein [Roseiflexaceae bacterium]